MRMSVWLATGVAIALGFIPSDAIAGGRAGGSHKAHRAAASHAPAQKARSHVKKL